MFEDWTGCKKILCIRADNMGDLVMSTPAMRALKQSFGAHITVFTSSMAAPVAPFLPGVDDVIVFDLPWVKTQSAAESEGFLQAVETLKERSFDAVVIFTVYSQNPLPAALLAYLAGIPKRLAFCRENPYQLLTHWVPDAEPLRVIKHQVRRDLDLVKAVGASVAEDRLLLNVPADAWTKVNQKISDRNVDPSEPYILIHAGVSEGKRRYPDQLWVETAQLISRRFKLPVLFTGSASEKQLAEELQHKSGHGTFSVAGLFSIDEFISLISHASLVISVNTVTVHLAAAANTPVIILYALTNPQHFPWRATGKVLVFDVPEGERSRNEIIRYVNDKHFSQSVGMVRTETIIAAASDVLSGNAQQVPEMMDLTGNHQ